MKYINRLIFLISFVGFLIFTIYSLTSCNQNSEKNTRVKKVNTAMLDSVMKTSDSVNHKEQYTGEFVRSDYYTNKKDAVLMQVMKAADSSIRQVTITKNNRRIYFAQYYDNGQLKGEYSFDGYGSNAGASKEYYRNGSVKEEGEYKAGFRVGKWQEYDSTGKKTELVQYDENGQGQRIEKK